MKRFEYIIKDDQGIHLRPAGLLAKEAKKYSSEILIEKDGEEIQIKRMMAVMALSIKKDEKIAIIAKGKDEELAIKAMEKCVKANL